MKENKLLSSEEFLTLGISKLNNGKFDLAIKDLNKSIKLNPKNPDAFSKRGYANKKLGNFANAIEDYKKEYELDPNCPMANFDIGIIFFEMNKFHKAIEHFSISIKIDENFVDAYKFRYKSRKQINDEEGANSDLIKIDQIINLNSKETKTSYIEKLESFKTYFYKVSKWYFAALLIYIFVLIFLYAVNWQPWQPGDGFGSTSFLMWFNSFDYSKFIANSILFYFLYLILVLPLRWKRLRLYISKFNIVFGSIIFILFFLNLLSNVEVVLIGTTLIPVGVFMRFYDSK